MKQTPAKADELAQQGKELYQSRDYAGAARAFAQAVDLFHQHADELKAAEMANNQAVALLQLDKAADAVDALRGTPQTFFDAGNISMAALAHGNLGQALAEAGQHEEAQVHYQQAIKLFDQIGDKENLQHTAKALSQLQLKKGDAINALFSMQRGLEGNQTSSLRDRLLRWLLRLPSRFLSR